MGVSHLRVDLGVIRQGLHLAFDFGLESIEEMTRVAELLERSVYELDSLRSDGRQVTFTLRNPPLRTGAFSAARLYWDGGPAPVDHAWAGPPGGPPCALASLTRAAPLTIPVGRRTEFGFPLDGQMSGTHRVRLELKSVAVPPLVWFEFSDRVREAPGA